MGNEDQGTVTDDHASINETFALISHPRRRLVLQYFNQHSNPIAVGDLAARVARWEHPGEEPPAHEVEQVQETLTTTHLPNFAKTVLATHDTDRDEVTYDGDAIAASLVNVHDIIGFLWKFDDVAAR